MLAKRWLGCALGLVLTLGCEKSGPIALVTAPREETSQVEPAVQLTDESLQLAAIEPTNAEKPALESTDEPEETRDDDDDELSPKAEAKLLAKLDKQPNDVDTLLKLASMKQQQAEMTDSGELDYGKLKDSADYVRRALKADPALAKEEDAKSFVAAVFFNEANALSLEKKDAAALKALRLAVDYGWSNLAEMQNAVDLAHIRKNPKFAEIAKFARDKRKKEMQATVSALFISKPDYEFDFKLEDTAGKPAVKQDFVGKLLVVNIWGTWCPPCRRELPDLIAAAKKYQSHGVEVLGINTEPQDGITAVNSIKDSQKTFGINYRCALGNDKVFEQIPDFSAVPMTLFFNRSGELQAQWVGQLDEIVLEMIIERLLEESPAETKK